MNTIILLALAMAIPFPLCLFRMKKYQISLPKMLVIYLLVSAVGFVGARFGPSFVGIKDVGVKLYGLVLLDSMIIIPMSKILKLRITDFADFVAPPIMAVCASSKINCLINNCCKGFVMYYSEGKPILFPSAVTEMTIWFVFVILLLVIEKRNKISGALWPALMILFGFIRFGADFLRGSEWEKRAYVMFLSGGQFWSLIILIIGIGCLVYAVQRNKKSFAVSRKNEIENEQA